MFRYLRLWDGSPSYSTRECERCIYIVFAQSNLSSTTYVGQVMAYETGLEPDHEYATRTGELGLLLYSIGRLPTRHVDA